jgi:hypothetical protein
MPGAIATIPRLRFSDGTSALAGGTVTIYAAGTTTPANTWQDRALTTLNQNPVPLDADGSCVIWLDSALSYKIVVKNAAGAVQWTQDNIEGGDVGDSIELAAPAIQAATDQAQASESAAAESEANAAASEAAAAISEAQAAAIVLGDFLQSGTGAYARTFTSKAREWVSFDDFGGIGDGTLHLLSERYGSLAAAQVAYPFATSLSQSLDWAAMQAAVNTGKRVRIFGSIPQRALHFGSDTLSTPNGTVMWIQGDGGVYVRIVRTKDVPGYLLKPGGSYNIEGVTLYGSDDDSYNTDGVYLLGNNDVGSSGGGTRLHDVAFYFCDIGINFGGNYQHPVGLNYSKVYGQFFRTCGMSIGGRNTDVYSGFNGESAFSFGGSVVLTNANTSGIEYASSVSSDTPSATQDTITWTGTVPRFGFCVLRSADGATDWHVPPNWSRLGYEDLSFVASKTGGETWNYKVVRMTVGVHVHRAKGIAADSLQAENFGVGFYPDGISDFHIGAFYYENSNNSNGVASAVPRPNFAGIWGRSAGRGTIGAMWCEYAGYGVFAADNSRLIVDNIDASDCFWAALGESGATDQFLAYRNANLVGTTPAIYRAPVNGSRDRQYAGLEYANASLLHKLSHDTEAAYELWRGGTRRGRFYCTSGGSFLEADAATIGDGTAETLAVQAAAKAGTIPTLQNTTLTRVALTNSVAGEVVSFTVPENNGGTLTFDWSAVVYTTSSVARQAASGRLTVSYVTVPGGATHAAAVADSIAKALSVGTLSDPTVTCDVTDDLVSVKFAFTSDQTVTSIQFQLVAVSMTGGAATAVTLT